MLIGRQGQADTIINMWLFEPFSCGRSLAARADSSMTLLLTPQTITACSSASVGAHSRKGVRRPPPIAPSLCGPAALPRFEAASLARTRRRPRPPLPPQRWRPRPAPVHHRVSTLLPGSPRAPGESQRKETRMQRKRRESTRQALLTVTERSVPPPPNSLPRERRRACTP